MFEMQPLNIIRCIKLQVLFSRDATDAFTVGATKAFQLITGFKLLLRLMLR